MAILLFAGSLWVSETIPLPMTNLLIPVLAVLFHIATPKEAFSAFANPVIYLFRGSFVLAGALSNHSLDRLLAHKLMVLAKGNFYKSSVLLMLATALTACWISNTFTAAMMIPLALGILALTDGKNATAVTKFLLLGIAYLANIGGIVTMIASPPHAISATLLQLTFSEWLLYGLPVFFITFPMMVVVLTLYFKPNRKMLIATVAVPGEKSTQPNMLLLLFAVTILLWVFEGVLSPLVHITSGFSS